MKKANTGKPIKQTHTARTRFGSGDYYGVGIKQKVGTVRRDYLNDVMPSKKLKNPPKTLA